MFIVKLNKIKPINNGVFDLLKNCKNIYFYEEAVKSGGVGSEFASALCKNSVTANFKHICVNDEFVKQASVSRQFEMYSLDPQSIINEVNNG